MWRAVEVDLHCGHTWCKSRWTHEVGDGDQVIGRFCASCADHEVLHHQAEERRLRTTVPQHIGAKGIHSYSYKPIGRTA